MNIGDNMITLSRCSELKEENEKELIFYYDENLLEIDVNSSGIFSINKEYFYFLSKLTDRIELLNYIMLGFIDEEFKIIKLHSNSRKEEGQLDEVAILCLEDIVKTFNRNNVIPPDTCYINKKQIIDYIHDNKEQIIEEGIASEDKLNDIVNNVLSDKKYH